MKAKQYLPGLLIGLLLSSFMINRLQAQQTVVDSALLDRVA